MTTADVVRAAGRHKQDAAELTNAATIRAANSWKRVNPGSVVSSWQMLMPSAIAAVMLAQNDTITSNEQYLNFAFNEQNIDGLDGTLRPGAIVGTMPATGATLEAAFAGVAYHTLDRIGRGRSTNEALQAGMIELSHLVQYAVADASRAASSVRIGTAATKIGYTRVVSAGCCARCAVLAGRYYEWNEGFLRHPACKCLHFPSTAVGAQESATDPYKHFEALSPKEQDRIYTKAGAEAIRNGADMNQVVNSRRGMTASGRFTSEGSGRRGFYRRTTAGQSGKRRLSVDEITRRSKGNKERFASMLTEYGYLTEYGQVAEGAIRGDRLGFGQFGRGGRRAGASEAVRRARETGVRDPRSRYTMTAAERREFNARS
ncbi:capsid maturation protease [Brevibacterium phage AGM4]|uniref:Capsid maturation protease n=1 Tax=Brevibacterium phage AGM4 TaxID=2591421 RepID=A0A7D0KII3_9CAUD|nr:capsid maturation protease [Brevibacterium phage AGM4]